MTAADRHADRVSQAHPFISFCLYVSARVFVQYLKSRPEDGRVADSLRFLLSAMDALKRRSPLTGSFLAQLDVDLEALVARRPKLRDAIARPAVVSTKRPRHARTFPTKTGPEFSLLQPRHEEWSAD